METTSNTRTLKAYVSDLLQLPRWIIAREVDFTDCPRYGHYNDCLPGCLNCEFGKACGWLDRTKFPVSVDVPLDELIEALNCSVEYLQSTERQPDTNEVEVKVWMREARRFLRSNHS